MEHQSNKCYSIGTNRTVGTNGPVECTPIQPETIGNILRLYNEMHFTNGTNGRVEWTPTQPEAIGNILSLYNENVLHQWNTNGLSAIPLVPIVPLVPMDE